LGLSHSQGKTNFSMHFDKEKSVYEIYFYNSVIYSFIYEV